MAFARLNVIVVLAALVLPPLAAAQSQPQSGMDWYSLGRSMQDAGQYDKAYDAFQHALDMKFQPAGALMRMAQIAAKRGDTADALKRLDAAYAISPFGVSMLPQLGGIPELKDNPHYQDILAKADEARHPCKHSSKAAQFDFWIGDWTVTNPKGQVVGHNTVTHDLSNCVVRESWSNVYGVRGTSVNFYDPATEQWHQVWTSENGTITHYVGEFTDGAMRFSANGFGDADGKTHFRRMTFTPMKDGSVRQFIEDSDDGKDWKTSFDGTYRKQ